MNENKLGISIIPLLHSPESIAECLADPVAFVENAGGSVAHIDDQGLRVLHEYLANIEAPSPSNLVTGAIRDHIRCTGCKAALAFTIAGMTATIIAVIVWATGATVGANTAAAPAEAVAGASVEMAAIGVETGLGAAASASTTTTVLTSWVAWAGANKALAVAAAASGAALSVIVGDLIDALCKEATLCK